MLVKLLLPLILLVTLTKQNVETHYKNGKHSPTFDKELLLNDPDTDSNFDDAVLKLSIPEQKEKLKSLVTKKIDENQDGFVDRYELEKWSLKAFNDYETEETREDFPFIDDDKDGFVSWKEFCSDSFGNDFSEDSDDFKNPESEEWKNFVEIYKKEKTMFEVADANKDEKLDLQEFMTFKHPKIHPETKKVLLQQTLEKSDLDKDGAISLEEYLGDYKKKADDGDPEWAIFETDKFKDDFDQDKDGLLTEDEIVNWVATDNKVLAIDETDHLISECDTNGDSKLTVDEILGNHEMWLDSDATDYGKYLLKNHDEF